MATFLITLALILLTIAGMAVGVMAGRPPVRSCGRACARGLGCPADCGEERR